VQTSAEEIAALSPVHADSVESAVSKPEASAVAAPDEQVRVAPARVPLTAAPSPRDAPYVGHGWPGSVGSQAHPLEVQERSGAWLPIERRLGRPDRGVGSVSCWSLRSTVEELFRGLAATASACSGLVVTTPQCLAAKPRTAVA
jgi:hypothetical protein